MQPDSYTGPFRRPSLIALVALALAAAAPAAAQTKPSSPPSTPDDYSIYEVGLFGGYQHFLIDNRDSGRVNQLDGGGVTGFRITEDWWNYIGIEESLTVGFNNLSVYPFGLTQQVTAGEHNYTLVFNPMIYFTPRTSKIRPFVTAGPGVTWYKTDQNFDTSNVPAAVQQVPLTSESSAAVIYGGGVKYNASKWVGLRFDFRFLRTYGKEFGEPEVPTGPGTIYIPAHNSENAWSATGGIYFRLGHRSGYVPPPPAPTVPPPVAHIAITGVTGAHDVCPGDSLELQVAASGWLTGQTPSYQWMVNGQPAPGATSSTFSVPTLSSGTDNITVRVSVPDSSQTSNPVTVTVKNYAPPTVQFTLSRNTIAFGDKLPLEATARASDCGGNTTLRYTASEGSISGNTFDSSTMTFDLNNRLKQQTKVVHLTATATDAKGGTGSATADLTVTLSPEARRLDDIIFPLNSARVNNCAKRLLLEQLTPMLRDDPNATVILIGHRDERERGRGAATLDRQRTLNAAAVLSAGTGICPMLELSRVKVKWVGTDQSDPTRPLMCGASTEVKERPGQAIRSNDQRAQFRRVEVWIVPGGAAMPPGITGLEDAPASDVKKLGCPK
ncbi:MAG TPA: outer membrane beta-barrel protein [Bryobacteraceae bacterium]|nr:outer membrane beta-barrel protein [Bryobacteraceae bacterium]